MKFKFIKKKKLIFPLVMFIFILWMLFFDANSYLYQKNHNREIYQLENTIEYYEQEIKKNRQIIDNFSIQENVNNYAREKYHYKKENEYVYLIEYDTLN